MISPLLSIEDLFLSGTMKALTCFRCTFFCSFYTLYVTFRIHFYFYFTCFHCTMRARERITKENAFYDDWTGGNIS